MPKHFERTASEAYHLLASDCVYSPESLNFVAFMKPNKHKMRSEGFSTTGRICFRILLRQSENFSNFCNVLSQLICFSQHDRTVT